MKSLDEIADDLSVLYDSVRDHATELKFGSELANIAGKNIKTHQIRLAREVFLSGASKLVIEDQTKVIKDD